ncbi:MAG: DUF2508 family protein [Firmicutes bacterium]|nr:DUF2508 family protein [Bacillota bacterium]
MKFKQTSYSQDDMLFDSIRSARSELDRATVLFNELTDDTGVDYASYNLLAARAKYSYLLKLAKEKKLSV